PKEAIKSEGDVTEEEGGGEEGGRRGRDSNKLTDVVNGHNRFVWNLRTAEAKRFPGLVMWAGGTLGPRVPPGMYQARVTVGEQPAVTVPFEVRQDPRSTSSAADLKAQFDFVTSVHDKLSEVNESVTRIRDVRKQLTDVKKRVADNKAVVAAANDLDKKMTAVEEALYQTKNKSSQDPLNYPIRLNDKLAGVGDSAASGPYAPTSQQIAVRDELVAKINIELAKLKAIWDTDLPAFNKLAAGVPVVK
ncbi:MAG TPA: glycosyl hydrolase, partial [Thermoanaerobaculia bacterium]